MVDYKISGAGFLPDGVTPLVGHWKFTLNSSNGLALDGNGAYRGYEKSVFVSGPALIELPGTTAGQQYRAMFTTKDRKFSIGPIFFSLTEDIVWTDILELPINEPATPTLLAQITELYNQIQALAAIANELQVQVDPSDPEALIVNTGGVVALDPSDNSVLLIG